MAKAPIASSWSGRNRAVERSRLAWQVRIGSLREARFQTRVAVPGPRRTLESSRRAPGGSPWRTPGEMQANAPRSLGSSVPRGQSQDARLCAQEGNCARIASMGEFEIIGTSNSEHRVSTVAFFPMTLLCNCMVIIWLWPEEWQKKMRLSSPTMRSSHLFSSSVCMVGGRRQRGQRGRKNNMQNPNIIILDFKYILQYFNRRLTLYVKWKA